MSIHVTSAAWKATGLSVVQKITLVKLADTAGDDGRCWPSVATIAKECGCTERAIFAALDCLESKGHISRIKRSGASTVYSVHPCTSFTPEPRSPLNHVHPTPERHSGDPCTSFTPPLNVVHPNRNRTVKNRKEPSINTGIGVEVLEVKKTVVHPPEPPPFDSPEFAEAWNEFRQHRKEIRKPLKPTGEKHLLRNLAKMGEPAAIAGMRRSIANGWQGVFPDRPQPGQPTRRTVADFECDHSKGF